MLRPLLEQLEAAVVPGGALAFDGDGTLWSGDVGEDVFCHAIEHGWFQSEGAARLRELATRWSIEPGTHPGETARNLLDAYRSHLLPELTACEMMAWAFAGHQLEPLKTLVDRVLYDVGLNARRFEPLHRVIEWARARKLRVIVVSASPTFVIERAVAALGIYPPDIAACEVLTVEGRLQPELSRPCPFGPHKVVAAGALLGEAALVGAFGDNAFDFEMLCSARIPVLVNPKPRLLARLDEIPRAWVFEHGGGLVQAT
jgi:phosphatidylglycerophosphatase C